MRPRANVRCSSGRQRLSFSLAATLAFACQSAGVDAAALTVKVIKPDGTPVVGAVVMLHGSSDSGRPAPEKVVIDQVDQTFEPDLSVIPVGSAVSFPNSDTVSHQVYSFSAAKRFQLPLYRGTPYAPTRFESNGIVTLGCNIHDDMIAYLVVTDAAWFGRTGPDGSWSARGLPAGEFRIEVWHPRLREKTQVIESRLKLEASQSDAHLVKLMRSLRPEPLGRKPRSWSDY